MDPNIESSDALIKKETLHPGSKYIAFKPGTRVKFHFQTIKCDGKETVLDDSRKVGEPLELVLGKKFKLEVWEAIVQKMALHEVAKFTVDKSLVQQYPFISKTLRDARKPPQERRHCCGMTIQNEGIGYRDLDELFSKPCDLQFIFELVSVELPNEYEKDSWQLDDAEKMTAIAKLRERGNKLYKETNYADAEKSYLLALGMVEELMLKEKPNDVEWLELVKIKIPLLLNFSQCKLLADDFYPVIEHCTEVLLYSPDNVKALFRRAKAHLGAWNPSEARRDFGRCTALDPALTTAVNKELQLLAEQQRIRDLEDKMKLQKLF